MSSSLHDSPQRYVTVFPAIGKDVPPRIHQYLNDPELLRAPHKVREMVKHLNEEKPHWLFHVEVLMNTSTPPSSPFMPDLDTPDWLQHLAGFLQIQKRFQLSSLEMIPRVRRVKDVPPLSFPIPPSSFRGRSYSLAIALGLVAATAQRPLPPWIVSSGILPLAALQQSLALKPIGKLEDKIELCLGARTTHDISPILRQIFKHPEAHTIYGVEPLRASPKKVQLLLIPRDTKELDYTLRKKIGIEPFRGITAQHRSMDDLKAEIDAIPDCDLLLVQVPSVWHALGFLGFHHEHPAISAMLRSGWKDDLRSFRVHHSLRGRGSVIGELARAKARVEESLNELELALFDVSGHYPRLQTILKHCANYLNCTGGTIARVTPDEEWLEVVASWGNEGGLQPQLPYVPANEGLNGVVLAQQKTQIARSPEEFQRLTAHLPYSKRIRARYGKNLADAYFEMVGKIQACVDVPLKSGDRVIGVLCLHATNERSLDHDNVAVIEALADRAAIELANILSNEKGSRLTHVFNRFRKTVEAVRSVSISDATNRLGNQLAHDALELTGAYRAAVRLLHQDTKALTLIGLAGGDNAWPEWQQGSEFPREEENACNHALDTDDHYLIPDTRQRKIHYKEIEPAAAAHIAIVLRDGLQQVGVLSVDFDQDHRIDCNPETVQLLEQLVQPYASCFRSYSSDRLIEELEAALPGIDPLSPSIQSSDSFQEFKTEFEQGLRDWLKTLGDRLGVGGGSLFLVDPQTGHYRFQTQLGDSDVQTSTECYRVGQGRTGWVLEHQKPLCIDDCADLREVVKKCPGLTESPHPDCWNRKTHRLAYLGVPLLSSSGVLGVLRLLCKTPLEELPGAPAGMKISFTNLDVQLARAAASQLTQRLVQLKELEQSLVLREFQQKLFTANDRVQLCEMLAQDLEDWFGDCCCVVRVVDRRDRGDGTSEPILDRLFVNKNRELFPQYRDRTDPILQQVWHEKKPWVIRDTRKDRLCVRDRSRDGDGKGWTDHYGCGIVVPLKAQGDVIGTLAVHRPDPGTFSAMDLAFIQKLADLTGPALENLVERQETRLVQEQLLWTALEQMIPLIRLPLAREIQEAVARNICQASAGGLSADEMKCWLFDDEQLIFRHLTDKDHEEEPCSDLTTDQIRSAFGEDHWIVVSDPQNDHRLQFLFDALPGSEKIQPEEHQQLAIWLEVSAETQIIPPTLFFLLVRQPKRLSYQRAEWLQRTLTAMITTQKLREE